MADLLKIKQRINSVTTTKKITKAMQLVATAKLGRTKNSYDNIINYYSSVKNVFNNLLLHSEDIENIINKKHKQTNEIPKTLYIVIGSDLGLCGAYNAFLVKQVKEIIDKDSLLITLGTKIINSLKKYEDQIIHSFAKIGDELDYALAQVISKKIYETIQNVYVDKVNIIYTEYINSISTETKIKQIYPIIADEIEQANKIDLSIYEPSARTILESSFIIYFEASMYLALANAKLSEMSSRRTAMENATNNAEELIGNLELDYNRSRQAKITEEITEIISGSNS
ncbi:ATP synthase F1 subunit gamma [Mycoplasma zalophi]|uniref:ATP synthase gamma chain n=1 Tax=Mycoplasma zalophi TaxID=191287 RepID=A0ABS6DPG3_9MOLU|nr:ATP synthase F1 subunit gamma [Mycoplasma zalophi]MBU4691015.1 ATP synthase F1 subunit gamma [Mycoplasma zalophi]MBU4692206.1 ATP synthase F1 subunit gamma [Mycoplasma zalophi]